MAKTLDMAELIRVRSGKNDGIILYYDARVFADMATAADAEA